MKEAGKTKNSRMGGTSNRLLRDKCAKVGSLFENQDAARYLVLVIRADSRNQAKCLQSLSKPGRQGPGIVPLLKPFHCPWNLHPSGCSPKGDGSLLPFSGVAREGDG